MSDEARRIRERIAMVNHPANWTTDYRLRLADLLDRMADNPADCFDPDKLRQARNLIYHQEAILTQVKAALG